MRRPPWGQRTLSKICPYCARALGQSYTDYVGYLLYLICSPTRISRAMSPIKNNIALNSPIASRRGAGPERWAMQWHRVPAAGLAQ
eukprot:3967917-Pyramimonas_sp.AAC.1